MGHAKPAGPYRMLRYGDTDEYAALLQEADVELLQTSRGATESRFIRYEGGQVTMHHSIYAGGTILRGAVDPKFLVLTLPLRWTDSYMRNGVLVEKPLLLAGEDEASRSATNLESLGFFLPKRPIEAASLAIAGPRAKARAPGNVAITGPPKELASLLRGMHRFDEAVRLRVKALGVMESREALEQDLLTKAIDLLSKLYGSSSNAHRLDSGDKRRAMRRAEDRFEAAGEEPVSLADLCVAAGVSARTLQYACHDLYGMTPMQYFKVRRLHKAHRSLKSATPERGAVKAAALGAGLTELGRFSVEYRELFGKSPSATLTES